MFCIVQIMKKLIHISFVIIALTMASCQKEEIKPRMCENDSTPVWRSANDVEDTTPNANQAGTIENNSSNSSNNPTGTVSGDPGINNPITDPNNDGDLNKRKRAN